MSKEEEIKKDLANVINRYSLENKSNTPDFILAEMLYNHLILMSGTINWREKWYGRDPKPIIKE